MISHPELDYNSFRCKVSKNSYLAASQWSVATTFEYALIESCDSRHTCL